MCRKTNLFLSLECEEWQDGYTVGQKLLRRVLYNCPTKHKVLHEIIKITLPH